MTSKPKSNGQTIFVTGVNGHIGNHIVGDLLAHGYHVKGSVRNLNDETKTASRTSNKYKSTMSGKGRVKLVAQ